MKELFTINSRFHGEGAVMFKWQPDGNFLATAGCNGASKRRLCTCNCRFVPLPIFPRLYHAAPAGNGMLIGTIGCARMFQIRICENRRQETPVAVRVTGCVSTPFL